MKRFLSPFLLFVFLFISYPTPIFAAQTNFSQPLCPPGNFGNLCKLKVGKAGGIVGSFVELLLIIAILLCLFFLIYGGIRYISSGGDKAKLDQARGTLTAAIIGLIVSLLAFFIINLLLTMITGGGLTSLKIPTLLQ